MLACSRQRQSYHQTPLDSDVEDHFRVRCHLVALEQTNGSTTFGIQTQKDLALFEGAKQQTHMKTAQCCQHKELVFAFCCPMLQVPPLHNSNCLPSASSPTQWRVMGAWCTLAEGRRACFWSVKQLALGLPAHS